MQGGIIMSSELIPYGDLEKMGRAIAVSGLFGMKTTEQACALMLIAQAEGKHPAIAARDYDIIQGRPALKSRAMLARYQESGGKMEWLERTDTVCKAKFTHPDGGTLIVDWSMDRAKRAGLAGKDNWSKYPRQMLSARVISEGVTATYPAATNGMYTPEEVQDFDDKPRKIRETTAEIVITHAEPPKIDDVPMPEEMPPEAEIVPPLQPEATRHAGSDTISEPQQKRLFALMKKAGKTIDQVKIICAAYGYESTKEIKRNEYDEICGKVEANPALEMVNNA
jgi:hypothetical protein